MHQICLLIVFKIPICIVLCSAVTLDAVKIKCWEVGLGFFRLDLSKSNVISLYCVLAINQKYALNATKQETLRTERDIK